jgi:hypothetical protein
LTAAGESLHYVISSDQRKNASVWAPLAEPLFRALWIASVASNIGAWMQNVAAACLTLRKLGADVAIEEVT